MYIIGPAQNSVGHILTDTYKVLRMESDSDDDNLFIPKLKPVRRGPPLLPTTSLPVQLTWKGIQIYFPSVVLTQDLKVKADEALLKRIAVESSVCSSTNSNVPSLATSKQRKLSEAQDSLISKLSNPEDGLENSNNSSLRSGHSASSKKLPKCRASNDAVNSSSSTTSTFSQSDKQCEICGSIFSSTYALRRHSLAHTNLDDPGKKFGPCACGAKYSRRDVLDRHMKVCMIAKSTGKGESETDTDLTSDTNKDVRIIKMESIEDVNSSAGVEKQATASTLAELDSHVDYDITPSGSHFQGDDPEDWQDEHKVPVVTSVTSTASEALECNHCGSHFSLNVQLKRHEHLCKRMCMSTDEESGRERKFHCEFCPWKYMDFIRLQRHIKSHHQGVRQYQCSNCMVTFERQDYLLRHRLSCTSSTSALSESQNQRVSISSSLFVPTVEEKLEEYTGLSQESPYFDAAESPMLAAALNDKNGQSSFNLKTESVSPEYCNSSVMASNPDQAKHSSSVTCDTCFRKFAARRYLLQHVCPNKNPDQAKHSSSSSVTCNSCFRKFAARRYLLQHVCLKNSGPRNTNENQNRKPGPGINCPFCEVRFSRHSNGLRHMRKRHKCAQCGEDFKHIEEKDVHSQRCTGNPPAQDSDLHMKFKCHICRVPFQPTELIRHMTSHIDSESSKLDTNTIGPVQSSDSDASQMLQFKCDVCGQQFPSKMELSRHCLTHAMNESKVKLPSTTESMGPSTPPPPVFTCKFHSCTHFFSHDEDLWFHIDKKHRSVGNICCGQCGQDFETEELVENHEQRVHTATDSSVNHDEYNLENVSDPSIQANFLPPHSPLAILSLDISRVIDASPTPTTRSVDLTFVRNDPLRGPAAHTLNQETKGAEGIYDGDDFFEYPMSDFDDVEDYEGIQSRNMLIPETKLVQSDTTAPAASAAKPKQNPYVLISSECRALAEAAFSAAIHMPSASHLSVPYGLDYYCCKICLDLKTFYERDLYIQHLKEHDISERSNEESAVAFRCHVCSAVGVVKTFNTRTSYRQHLNYHRKTGRSILNYRVPLFKIQEADEYFCKTCHNRKFTDRKAYVNHLKHHKRVKKVKGYDGPLGTIEDIRRRSDIPFQSEYTCPHCEDLKFTVRQEYMRHLYKHKATKRRQTQMKKSGGSRPGHMRPDIPILSEYTCPNPNCLDRKFTDRAKYIAHVNCHDKIQREEKKKAERANNSRRDIPVSPTGEYSCSTCDNRMFTDRLLYISHVQYHEKLRRETGSDRPIGICGRVKSSPTNRNDIPFSDVYTCSICNDREFTDRTAYFNHVKYHDKLRKVEGADRPIAAIPFGGANRHLGRPDIPLSDEYTCELCDDKKTFTNRIEYLAHLRHHKLAQQKSFKSSNHWRKKRQAGRNSWLAAVPFSDTYKCETCHNREFNNRDSYIGHLMYHKILEKKGCNRVILSKEEWLKNRERHKDEVPDGKDDYQCEICPDGRKFSSRPSYISHIMYHEKLKRMGINRPLRKKWEHRTLSDSIPENGSYTCSICENRSFNKLILYNMHMKYHEKVRAQEGQDRPIRTDWREHRSKNSFINQLPNLDKYECEICNDGRSFDTKIGYIAHLAYHKKRQEQGLSGPLRKRGAYLREDIPISDTYTCTRCERRTFTDRSAYINHINYHDIKDKQQQGSSTMKIRRRVAKGNQIPFQSVYHCTYCIHSNMCNKFFTDRAKYIAHMHYHKRTNSVDSEGSRPLPTLVQTSNPLNPRVTKTPDDPEEKFYCTLCGTDTVFTCQDAYAKHMKDHRNTKKKEFQCSICEKAFSNIWNLKDHAKIHTGEKNFICGDCGKRFVTDSFLQHHQLKICKKVPCKYTCHCGDKFHSVDALERHVKKDHTDAKVSVSKIFRCYVCNDQFLQAFELDQHVRDNHPVDYAEFMQHKAEKAQLEAETNDEELVPNLYPEVLMECLPDDNEEHSFKTETVDGIGKISREQSDINEETSPNDQEEENSGGGGWNFIPGLTGENEENDEDGTSESEQMDDDFIPDSFEPEDVEVPINLDPSPNPTSFEPENVEVHINIDPSPNPTSSTISTLMDKYPQLSLSAFRTPTVKRKQTDADELDEDWTPSTSAQDKCEKVVRRRFKGDGNFQCGYCSKVSHRVSYLKTHSSVHSGLPFKYINLETEAEKRIFSDQVCESIRQTLKYKYPPSTTAAAATVGARPYRYVLPQQVPPLPHPVVATVSPLTNTLQQPPTATVTVLTGRRSSNDGAKQRPAPVCSCAYEDTALGYHKRCTGETCACYTRYKGCSDTCECKRYCGNPYFRTKVPVPPIVQENTMTFCSGVDDNVDAAGMQQAQVGRSGLSGSNNTIHAATTVQDVMHSLIEGAFRRASGTPQSSSQVVNVTVTPSVSNSVPESQSSWSSNDIQKRTLGVCKVTGYVNPVNQENSCSTGSTNFGEPTSSYPTLTNSLSNPVIANVPLGVGNCGVNAPMSSKLTLTPVIPVTSSFNSTSLYSPSSNVIKIRVPSPSTLKQGTGGSRAYSSLTSGGFTRFENARNPKDAEITNTNVKIYRCFCQQDFNTLSSFLLHQWNHKEERLFLCPICKKQFSSVSFLILHARKHAEVEEIAVIPCRACDKLLSDKDELDRHFTSCHATLICEVCQQYCGSKGDLASHRLTHGVCNICGLTFFNQSAMRNHLARDHASLRSQFCVQPVPSVPTSSNQLITTATTGTISSGDGTGPEVVTVVDLDDDDIMEIPPSPEAPVIVSVAGTIQNDYGQSTQVQDYDYLTFNN